MHQIKPKADRTMVITIKNPTTLVKGHPPKRGAGTHTDKRNRRTDRRTRNQGAIREWN